MPSVSAPKVNQKTDKTIMKRRKNRTRKFIFTAILAVFLYFNFTWQPIANAQSSLNALGTCAKDPSCASQLGFKIGYGVNSGLKGTAAAEAARISTYSGASYSSLKGHLAFIAGVTATFTGGLLISLWGEDQTQQARDKATGNLCLSGDLSCGSDYRITYSGCDGGFVTQNYTSLIYPSISEATASNCPRGNDIYKIAIQQGSAVLDIYSWEYPQVVAINAPDWVSLTDSQKQSGVDSLTPDDYYEIAQSSPVVGSLSPGDTLSGLPILVVPQSGGEPTQVDQYKHPGDPNANLEDKNKTKDGLYDPNDDIDGDGILNKDDPDIDGDGIPNDEDEDLDGDGTPDSEEKNYPYQDPALVPISPDAFSKPNFFQYGIQRMSDKFPFDFFTGIPSGSVSACPSFTFFTRTQEICLIRDFLSALKWPAMIGFAIWGFMEI